MPLPKIIPALADLTQDIAGPVPLRLLHDWATGEQDLAAAEELLQPFAVEGTVVSSDTSGLSLLTQSMDLLDVLSLISQPKEIVHAVGRAIGGRAIGTWVADNTEMLYPATLDPETVLEAMGEVQFRIQERLRMRIGMCVHPGSFYEIGGGLYGGDAEEVEALAENCAGPGEILLTERMATRVKRLSSDDMVLQEFPQEELRAWLLKVNPRMPNLEELEPLYPHPFPKDFYEMLPHFFDPGDQAAVKQRIYDQWLRERIVVFLARQRGHEAERTVAGLLDDLVVNGLMDAVIRGVNPGGDHIASSGGGIAILTFDHPSDAVAFVRTAHDRFADNGLPVVAGVDAGPVLMFQTTVGPSGIAGDPINVASKLAEDLGRVGCISVTDRAARKLGSGAGHEPFEVRISGITLKGIILTS